MPARTRRTKGTNQNHTPADRELAAFPNRGASPPHPNKKIEELNNLLPHNGRWHTVYEEDDVSIIDGIPIIKKEKDSMT